MPEPPVTSSRCPYPGLRPFRSEEADLFFGREEQIRELRKRLERGEFLAVVGESGCGKSSLVLAGLIPEIRPASLARRVRPGPLLPSGQVRDLSEHGRPRLAPRRLCHKSARSKEKMPR